MKRLTNQGMQDALRRLGRMVSYMVGDSGKFNRVPGLLEDLWRDYPQLDPCHPSEVMDLNDFPKWSAWPARVLGLAPWEVPTRDLAKVLREYDGDKFGEHLKQYREKGSPDMEKAQKEGDNGAKVITLWRGSLIRMGSRDHGLRLKQIVHSRMRKVIEESTTVVELGCGSGGLLWSLWKLHPNKRFVGGDVSDNAVKLANSLCRDIPAIKAYRFNFYDSEYSIFDKIQARAVIFTMHGIEQLPSAKGAIETLCRYRGRISDVFHFEPVYELHDCSALIGLMRKRYAEINDYNRDLLSVLRTREDIRIIETEPDIFGNPIHPMSVIHWRFKDS